MTKLFAAMFASVFLGATGAQAIDLKDCSKESGLEKKTECLQANIKTLGTELERTQRALRNELPRIAKELNEDISKLEKNAAMKGDVILKNEKVRISVGEGAQKCLVQQGDSIALSTQCSGSASETWKVHP